MVTPSELPGRGRQREVVRDGAACRLVAAGGRARIVLDVDLEGARRLTGQPVLPPRPEQRAELLDRQRRADRVATERLLLQLPRMRSQGDGDAAADVDG